VIAATFVTVTFATPAPLPNSDPVPRFMSGPTAEDVIRANGIDPALVIE
jgi:hypothetical protein